jgi:two-component system chemotaxis response regulator CheY
MRDMLRMALAGAGFNVVEAVDGEHGLEVLSAHRPDVIITDINMPKLDGFGFIEAVRVDDDYRAIPILVLTTGWIVKPFNPEKLVEAIRRVAA